MVDMINSGVTILHSQFITLLKRTVIENFGITVFQLAIVGLLRAILIRKRELIVLAHGNDEILIVPIIFPIF